MNRALIVTTAAALSLFGLACADDSSSDGTATDSASTDSETGDGDGDNTTTPTGEEEDSSQGDGDGDPAGDGDGDTAGDGDGDTAGDGDGDTAGDGDGDTGGDGDGDTGGDGDGDTGGDGDGDTGGDGDGDTGGDGDGDTGGDGDGDPDCQAPPEHITCDSPDDNPTPLQALGLDCPGDASNSTPTTADSFNAPDNSTYRIAQQYGTSGDWVATEGEQVLVISTGNLPAPNNQGIIDNGDGSSNTGNPDNQQLPAPLTPNDGSDNGNGGDPFQNCDGIGDCSGSLEAQWMLGQSAANDLLWFDFSVDVPIGTTGWIVDFVYYSNEFPEFVDSSFNDIFMIWEVSESYVGNMCFIDGEPCTVTALDAAADAFSGVDTEGSPSLAGTGCQGQGSQGGQTTGLFSIEGPATPEENMELTFAVFDMGDTAYDTMVLLDNWRWNCQGCIPNEVDNCGVQPQ